MASFQADKEKIDLHEVFRIYDGIYRNILTHIWPSLNSTGFAERNLSVNFSKAYERCAAALNQDVVTWFEFQIPGKSERNDNHIDGVIINCSQKEIIMLESKRFSDPRKKKTEILKDIARLDAENAFSFFNGRLEQIEEYALYGCILSDVWSESTEKEKIIEAFRKYNNHAGNDSGFMKDLFGDTCLNSQKYEDKEIKVFLNEVGETLDTHNAYYLASFMWKCSAG